MWVDVFILLLLGFGWCLVVDLYMGIDVGASWLRVAVADVFGSVVKRVVVATPRCGDVVGVLLDVVEREFRGLLDRVRAVGVGTIGPLDIERGVVVNPPNLPVGTIDLGKPLVEVLKKPVYIANDCVAAVWGEKVFGVGRDVENLVYITISTGIGGGMIVDGVLLLGKKGNAHEVGHIVVDVLRRMRCGCGGYGHWEAYASGANIPRFAALLIESWTLDSDEKQSPVYRAYLENALSSELIYREARRGDKLALKIVDEITKINIAGFETVVNIYDPEIITVGGSVALNNVDLVIEPVKKSIESRKGLVTDPPKIMPTPLGGDAVLLGAIALAIKPPRELVSRLRYLSTL